MKREPVRTVRGRAVVLPAADVDTDQIIPARFLTGTTRDGLGRWLFAGWRYGADGEPNPEFALNHPDARGAGVLVAGDNFGCGSSREHAVWALLDYGFRAVVSTRFADIFRSNALKNGLLPVAVDAASHARFTAAGDAEVTVDLAAQEVRLPDGFAAPFAVDPFAKYCLLNGVDELAFLLEQEPAIAAYEDAVGRMTS
jgi:3-isopropylmalate/(R)-2-methylmalate dehydratase small subunit